MAGKSFLVDTTRCIACRGCQVACKDWNGLPGTKTRQQGSQENPTDLSAATYRLVRFREAELKDGRVRRHFFSEACRHCLEPPCKDKADQLVPGAIVIEASGAVVYTDLTIRLGSRAGQVIKECPYNVPRLDRRTGRLVKCHLCHTRLRAGLPPACAAACPTGALVFGDRPEILKLANLRLAEARKKFGPQTQILDSDMVRALYLVVGDPEKYSPFATYGGQ